MSFRYSGIVVLPLDEARAIAALAVLIFTFIWNDFFWATVLTQGEASKPMTAGVTRFQRTVPGHNWHLISAASLVAAVPACCDVLFDAETLYRRSDYRAP